MTGTVRAILGSAEFIPAPQMVSSDHLSNLLVIPFPRFFFVFLGSITLVGGTPITFDQVLNLREPGGESFTLNFAY